MVLRLVAAIAVFPVVFSIAMFAFMLVYRLLVPRLPDPMDGSEPNYGTDFDFVMRAMPVAAIISVGAALFLWIILGRHGQSRS